MGGLGLLGLLRGEEGLLGSVGRAARGGPRAVVKVERMDCWREGGRRRGGCCGGGGAVVGCGEGADGWEGLVEEAGAAGFDLEVLGLRVGFEVGGLLGGIGGGDVGR